MFTLYHNLETADGLRSDGAGIIGAVKEALQMWKEEKKAVIFETVLEEDGEVYYTQNGEPPRGVYEPPRVLREVVWQGQRRLLNVAQAHQFAGLRL